VLGVEDHRDVEGLDDFLDRFLAESHPEEVRGVAQVIARLHNVLAVPAPLVIGHDGRHGREKVNCLGHVGLPRGVLGQGVPCAHDRGRGPADIHRMRGGGQCVHHLLHDRIDRAAGAFPRGELRQLFRGGQFTVPEQVGDFLEAAPGSEFLDGVAAVQQRVGV